MRGRIASQWLIRFLRRLGSRSRTLYLRLPRLLRSRRIDHPWQWESGGRVVVGSRRSFWGWSVDRWASIATVALRRGWLEFELGMTELVTGVWRFGLEMEVLVVEGLVRDQRAGLVLVGRGLVFVDRFFWIPLLLLWF